MKKVILIAIILLHFICFSQSNPPPPGLEDEVPAVPIDQIEIILFFTAIYLGVYFIYRRPKKKNEETFPEKKAKFGHHSHKTDKLQKNKTL